MMMTIALAMMKWSMSCDTVALRRKQLVATQRGPKQPLHCRHFDHRILRDLLNTNIRIIIIHHHWQ